VVIIADLDNAGRDHARQIAEMLRGIAAGMKLVEARADKDAPAPPVNISSWTPRTKSGRLAFGCCAT